MRKIYLLVCFLCCCFVTIGFSQANTTLSNLASPTAANQDLLPGTDAARSFGSTVKGWKNIYLTNGVYIKDSLFVHGTGVRNAYLGTLAGGATTTGYDNSGSGYHALFVNAAGQRNTAFGSFALSKTTVSDNTALGAYTLQNTSGGSANVAVGSFALSANTTGSNNIAAGYAPLFKNNSGNSNGALGFKALYSNTSGYSNIAFGPYALYSSINASRSIAIGDSALYRSTGSSNVAIGSKALYNNVAGTRNTAVGYNANISSPSYTNATAIGSNAYVACGNCMVLGGVSGVNGASASTSVGIGITKPVGTLHINNNAGNLSLSNPGHIVLGDVGDYNLGMDYYQLQARYDSTYSALYLNNWGGTTYAGNSSTSYYGLVGYASNYGVYGSSRSNGVYGSGDYGVYGSGSTYGVYGVSYTFNMSGVYGTGSSSFGVQGNSTNNYGGYFSSDNFHGLIAIANSTGANIYAGIFKGSTYCYGTYVTSDVRVKKNINDMKDGMALINQLKPKTYDFRNDGKYANLHLPKGNQYGLLAQDVEKLFPSLVQEAPLEVQDVDKDIATEKKATNPDSAVQKKITKIETMQVKAINYTELIPVMIKGMQELDKKTQRIDELENEVKELKQLVQQLAQTKTINSNASYLSQNVPNPTNGNTIIPFQIAVGSKKAFIQITQTGSGKVLQTIAVNANDKKAFVNTSALATGSYIYTLIVDGKVADSKQMLLSGK